MAVWQTWTLFLPLLTLHIVWLFPHASFGVAVKCWWRRVSSVSHNVSIECQAEPQGTMLEHDWCKLHVLSLTPKVHVSQTGCSHMGASFTTLMDAHEMQSASCSLLCPGQTLLPCGLQKGYPPPTCLIPYDDEERNIHCHWTGSLNPLIPTNFTLHWKADDKYRYHGSVDIRESGIIPRAKYPAHDYIEVWVSAINSLGKNDSETFKTYTHRIIQPATPSISSHSSLPLEIYWDVADETEYSRQWQCKVQYKKQCDREWSEVEDTYEVSFTLEDAVPFTTYKFRVRCRHDSDERAVMSNWSSEYTAKTPAAAPVGMLDVWSDCESPSEESNCTILWKEMPMQQARGNINSYGVTMMLSNGSVLNMSRSVYTSAEMCSQCGLDMIRKEPSNLVSHLQQRYLTCPQEQDQSCFHYCHLSVPVKEMKSVGVAANATGGMSSPALVPLPRTGLLQKDVTLEVIGKSQQLNVFWVVPRPFSDNIQEYVVQHKPIGLHQSQCLNWVRVHKNQTSVILRGQLLNYTAYNISLFAIVNNRSCLLKSVIAYTVEGVPPKVTDFHAIPTSPFTVNLIWTPIPLTKSKGHVIKYHVFHEGLVHHVSSNQSSYQLEKLNPGQPYEVWIRAITSAGEGEKTTASFTTTSSGDITQKVFVTLPVLVFLGLFIFVFMLCYSKGTKWFYKIPDPINSSSFKQMSNQFWHSLPVASATLENGLTISQVEVVSKPEVNHEHEGKPPEEHREHEPSRGKELHGNGGLELDNSMLRREAGYSQMIDSSDEDSRDDDEWSEEQFHSDYEKHFLPVCTVDV